MASGHTVRESPVVVQPGELSLDAPLPLRRIRHDVDAILNEFLDTQAAKASDSCLPPLVEIIRDFLTGGKRLRPLFCVCGWVAAGGDSDASEVLKVGAALELFHSFALIHDDLMDASDSRRGQPTVHRVLAARADKPGEPAAAEHFGASAAILLGDICMVWSDELLNASGVEPQLLHTARPLIDAMRTEVMAGQYLDVEHADDATSDALERAWRVIRHKTAAYTVIRPIQIGAALTGADETLLQSCVAYGQPIGEAFQLRDDLLGVFGHPSVTGKPALDDLRAGKRTVLMALTWQRASPAQRATIGRLHGNATLDDDGAEQLRDVIRETGADCTVEDMIAARLNKALAALREAPMSVQARRGLAELAETATQRRY
jgi:geranylgeranyl diphosphate synthase, type I